MVTSSIAPQLIQEISAYIQGSKGILMREFNQIDRNMTGFLPVWDIKKVFQNNGYASIRVDDIEQFAINFGVYDFNSKCINYPRYK